MITKLFLLTWALALFAGCAGLTSEQEYPAPPLNEAMRSDGVRFADALAACPIRSVVLTDETLQMYGDNLAPLFERLQLLSFNRILCEVSSSENLNSWRPVAEYAAACGIETQLLLRQRDFTGRDTKQAIFTMMADKIDSFNSSLSSDAKLAGAIFVIEIHLFTQSNVNKPSDLLYAWGENNYGSGGDNNMLLDYALEQMQAAKKNLPNVPLVVGMPDFYLFAAETGKLDQATLTAVLELGEANFIDLAGNLPGDIAANFNSVQKLVAKPMVASIKLSSHIAQNTDALRKRNWADLVNSMQFIFGNGNLSANFNAMALGPFITIESILSRP